MSNSVAMKRDSSTRFVLFLCSLPYQKILLDSRLNKVMIDFEFEFRYASGDGLGTVNWGC